MRKLHKYELQNLYSSVSSSYVDQVKMLCGQA